MSALILIKSLNLIFAVMMDSQPHDFYQLSKVVHNLLFYIIEALLGVGLWKSISSLHQSLWKPISSLHQRVRTVTLITISLQIFADAVLFAINGHRARLIGDFKNWNSVFLATNLMCFLPVMTLAVWSIKLHKESSEDDEKKTSSNDSSELRKLMGTYITAMGYLHFLYLLVLAPSVTANVGRKTIVIAEEGAHLALCMVMLYQFRPATKEASEYQNILENDDHSVAAKGKGDPEDSKCSSKLPDCFYAGLCLLAVIVLHYFLPSIF